MHFLSKHELAECRQRRTLRRTLPITGAIGTLLTGINEGDVLVHGRIGPATGVKVALNYCVPFVVSNLGVVAGLRGRRSPE